MRLAFACGFVSALCVGMTLLNLSVGQPIHAAITLTCAVVLAFLAAVNWSIR